MLLVGTVCPSAAILLVISAPISLTTELYLLESITVPVTAGNDAPGGEKLPDPFRDMTNSPS
jgi:hypothetical protein